MEVQEIAGLVSAYMANGSLKKAIENYELHGQLKTTFDTGEFEMDDNIFEYDYDSIISKDTQIYDFSIYAFYPNGTGFYITIDPDSHKRNAERMMNRRMANPYINDLITQYEKTGNNYLIFPEDIELEDIRDIFDFNPSIMPKTIGYEIYSDREVLAYKDQIVLFIECIPNLKYFKQMELIEKVQAEYDPTDFDYEGFTVVTKDQGYDVADMCDMLDSGEFGFEFIAGAIYRSTVEHKHDLAVSLKLDECEVHISNKPDRFDDMPF